MPSVQQITHELETWAPAGSKLDFDRVGLQVGHPDSSVERVLVALDLTPSVVDEAEAWDAQLIITHHPLLFRPLPRLVPTDLTGALAYRLAQLGTAYYAIHTNLDAAPGGVSFALAARLGLADVRFLAPTTGALVKLVTFVPETHLNAVREDIAAAGAGVIGQYEACAFVGQGTGYFKPGAGANPFVGSPGSLEAAPEMRVEVEVPRWHLPHVLAALRSAHPYEEVAYDVYPVEQPHTRSGLGAVGVLPDSLRLAAFLTLVSDRLEAEVLRYVGDPDAEVRRVAVCGGAGSSLIGAASREGADAYLTADVTYHTFFEALDPDGRPRMALVDAGHYETEWVVEPLLVERLVERFADIEVRRARQRTSPIRTYARCSGDASSR